MTSSKLFDSPTVPPLHKLIDDVIEGGIMVPKFQRGFVWNDEQRIELLDSVLRGMPIGSLFVWKTRLMGIQAQRFLGNRALKVSVDESQSAPRTFLLDGLQRVTTLVGALAPIDGADTTHDLAIFYDLSAPPQTPTKERLSVRRRLRSGAADPTQLPLHLTLDDFAMSEFQANLLTLEEGDRRSMIRESQRVASTIKGYPVPIVPIVSDEIDLVTESFQRVNSTGTRMSEEHMATALTFANGIDLPKSLEGIAEGLREFGWGDLDARVLLSALKAMFHIELSKPHPSALQTMLVKLKGDGRDPFAELEPHARDAARFLAQACHIRGPEVLPYTYQFVALCEAAAKHDLASEPVRARYVKWFWATTFSEHFASMNSTQLGRAIEFARAFGTTPPDHVAAALRAEVGAEPIERVTRFNFNGARTRALSVILGCAAEDEDPSAQMLDRLGAEGNAVMQVLLRTLPQSRPGNRVLARPTELSALRDLPWRKDDEDGRRLQRRHRISDAAIAAWSAGDNATFLRLRGEQLWAEEKAFIERMVPGVFSFKE